MCACNGNKKENGKLVAEIQARHLKAGWQAANERQQSVGSL